MKKNYFFRIMFVALITTTLSLATVSCNDDEDEAITNTAIAPRTDESGASIKLLTKTVSSDRTKMSYKGILQRDIEYKEVNTHTYSPDSLLTGWVQHLELHVYKDTEPINPVPNTLTKTFSLNYNDKKQLVSLHLKQESLREEESLENTEYTTVFTYGDNEIMELEDDQWITYYKFNNAGQVVEIKTPVKRYKRAAEEDIDYVSTLLEYDANGNMTKTKEGDRTSTLKYDDKRNHISFANNPLLTLRPILYKHHLLGRNNVTEEHEIDASAGDDNVCQRYDYTSYEYDSDGYPISSIGSSRFVDPYDEGECEYEDIQSTTYTYE